MCREQVLPFESASGGEFLPIPTIGVTESAGYRTLITRTETSVPTEHSQCFLTCTTNVHTIGAKKRAERCRCGEEQLCVRRGRLVAGLDADAYAPRSLV